MSDTVASAAPLEEQRPDRAPAASAPAPAAPSWLDQDEVLRDMWMQNRTPQDIAEALNRSVPAIMTRAARLGLPRRSAPGRKPGRKMPVEGSAGDAAIAARAADSQRRAQARMASSPANEAPVTSLRICLMCLHKFESLGRHNRICPSCKGSAEYETACGLSDIQLATV